MSKGMVRKKIVEVDANGLCFHEFEYVSRSKQPVLAASHIDVTSRNDGPFLGRIYDRENDTWSDPSEESGDTE